MCQLLLSSLLQLAKTDCQGEGKPNVCEQSGTPGWETAKGSGGSEWVPTEKNPARNAVEWGCRVSEEIIFLTILKKDF